MVTRRAEIASPSPVPPKVRVVELSDDPAGAYCGKVLADLGAEVVRVVGLSGSEMSARPGVAIHFNTNKRSLALKPGDAARRDDVMGLLAVADLVVESPGRGDLAEIGLDREELRARHQHLVIASVSGFGVEGPYATYRWSDLVAQTAAGFTLPQGRPSDRTPVKHPALVAMCTLGHTLACGALAGVRYSRSTGIGTHIDCAAYEALAAGPSRVGRGRASGPGPRAGSSAARARRPRPDRRGPRCGASRR